MNFKKILNQFVLVAIVALVTVDLSAAAASNEVASAGNAADAKSGVVYIIPIRDMISPALVYVIKRQVAEAEADNAQAIIFPMHTPGGAVASAESIVDLISNLDIPVYTFVERDAISAGALIALGTDAIYMAPGSKIGNAIPFMGSPFGGAAETPDRLDEKIESYVAASARGTAMRKGHNPEVAEAMVRLNYELVINGEIISPAGQVLTLTAEEAKMEYGDPPRPLLSSGTVKDVDELLQLLELDGLKKVEPVIMWSERIARFIPGIAPFLLIFGALGIYIEFRTPGFGIPGVLGGIFLLIFFWGHHIAGLAGYEEILIFLFGLLLLLIELFVIPGFGVIGFAGIILMLAGLFLGMVPYLPGDPILPHIPDLQFAFRNLLYAIVGSSVAILIAGKFLPRTSLFRHLVLEQVQGQAVPREEQPTPPNLLGETGVTLSTLRPSGVARFGDERRDVLSRGRYITKGAKVKIVRVEGSRIFVEPEE